MTLKERWLAINPWSIVWAFITAQVVGFLIGSVIVLVQVLRGTY